MKNATNTARKLPETDFQDGGRRGYETGLRATLNRAAIALAPANEAPTRAAWTDDQIERLKQLWAEGQSAAAIAKTLGLSGKNAVIGKVNRLGLTRKKTTPWTPARNAQLKTLWRENWSVERLAAHFDVSLSALRSKARHMGLFRGKTPASAPQSKAQASALRPVPAEASVKTAPTRLKWPEPEPHHIALAQLTTKTCRWPFGGDEHAAETRFCGCKAEDGAAYCSKHAAKARKR